MATALDNLVAGCSYGGVPFFLRRQGGLPDAPRFDAQGAFVERMAPFSFPAVVVLEPVNTGLLSDITRTIALKGSDYTAMKAKVLQGMAALQFMGDASQQAVLTSLKTVGAVPRYGFVLCTATWRGR